MFKIAGEKNGQNIYPYFLRQLKCMSAFIKSIYFRAIFFETVITMFENELLLLDKNLNLLQQNAVQTYHCHLPYLQSRRLAEDLKARNNGTDLDSNLGLCLLNYRRVSKKHL